MNTGRELSLRRHPNLWMGIALVSLIVLMGIVSFFYLPFDPTEVSEQRLSAPSASHISALMISGGMCSQGCFREPESVCW